MKILQFRNERLNEIIDEARGALPGIREDRENYSELIFKLILDILYRLMENEITLECMFSDLELVKIGAKKASTIFSQNTGINVNISVIGNLSEEL